MHSVFSNTALSLQAQINKITRPFRKRRQYQKNWQDNHIHYATGSLFGDAALGITFGLVIFLWVVS